MKRSVALFATALLLSPSVARAEWGVGFLPAAGVGHTNGSTLILAGTVVARRGPLFLGVHGDVESCLAYCAATAVSGQLGAVNGDTGLRLMAIGELGYRWLYVARDEDAGGGSASGSLPFAGARFGLALASQPNKNGVSVVGALFAFVRHDLYTRKVETPANFGSSETFTVGGPSVGALFSVWLETR